MSKAHTKRTNNLVIFSDIHAGCRMGLCPPGPSPLDGGGTYYPSEIQLKMWAIWLEFWQWVKHSTRGEPYDLICNGDSLDGNHHNSTSQISHNMIDQLGIAEAILKPVVARCKKNGGTFYMIRGTEAHIGQSAEFEERLARILESKPNAQGDYARWDLWKEVGDALVHILHHVGGTSSAAHESSAINAELVASYVEAARWGRRPPDFIVRSHRHRSIAVDMDSSRGPAAAIVTAGWQLKTPFSWKISGARLSEPQVGGVLIRQGKTEGFFYRRWVRSFDRSPVE